LINNKTQIVDNGTNEVFKDLRSDACNILEEALKNVDPEQSIYNALSLEGNVLKFKGGSINISNTKRIIVIGGGKAGGLMAKAVEKILGDLISCGYVNVLDGTEDLVPLKNIQLNGASHPIPSNSGVIGVQEMIRLTSDLNREDLVITLISGGGSALMPLPASGVSLKGMKNVTTDLLKSGATINELNSVRKHLSAFKGGQLARHCYPASVLSLILSDVIGDPLDVIASGPTAPDTSTFKDAFDVLKKFNLLRDIPDEVRLRISKGLNGEFPDTPKKDDPLFENVFNIIIANNSIAANAAKKKAEELGYNSMILSTYVEGEAREVGKIVSGIAKEIIHRERPIRKPAAIIMGGETTVKVMGQGKGGRNQELTLGASLALNDTSFLIASFATDGIDGPTEAAGAVIDGDTIKRAKLIGLDPNKYLKENNSYNFFKALGDNIITGPTLTNVNDLIIILVR
jgi:glycerate 2-kinase